MEVTVINPSADSRWDEFVEGHPLGWICHLSCWKTVLEKRFKHMKGHYLVLLSNNNIKAALPVFEVRSWLTGNRLVSVPFATLFDPLVSDSDDMNDLLKSTVSLSNKLKTSYIEIRTFASSSLIQDKQFGVQNLYKHHYLRFDTDLEQLKKTFDRTCVRQRISRAQKSNLKLKTGEHESDMQVFYKLYVMTRKRLSLPPQPYIFFKMLWESFSPLKRVEILLAEYQDKVIAGVILFKFKRSEEHTSELQSH